MGQEWEVREEQPSVSPSSLASLLRGCMGVARRKGGRTQGRRRGLRGSEVPLTGMRLYAKLIFPLNLIISCSRGPQSKRVSRE